MGYLTVLFVYIKRQLKGGFLLALLCMPVLVLGIKYFIPQETVSPTVGFYTEGNDTLSVSLSNELLNHKGYVTFQQAESRQALENLVRNRSVECGYVIPSDLSERVDSLDLKKAIICGENPSSILSDIIDEIVFSKLIYCCGDSVVSNFAEKENINTDKTQINKLYDEYINSDKVFSLTFEKINTDINYAKINSNNGSISRGLMAVYIMLGGLFGTIPWYKDEKRKIYVFGSGNVIASVILMCIFGLISLFISGDYMDISKEIILMALYGAAVCGYCCMLKMIFGSHTVMCGAYPILTLGALCFCPVIFDISIISASLSMVGRVFIPYYYIDYINGGSIYGLLFAGIICWVLYLAMKCVVRR